MLKLNFFIILIVVIPLWFGYRIKQTFQKNGFVNLNRELLLNVFFIYLLGVVFFTMYPFVFNLPFLEGAKTHYHFDFRLFYLLRNMSSFNLQLFYSLGNILMLLPFGFLIPFFTKVAHRLINVLLLGFTFSLSIELTQTFFTLSRRGTVDDLLFNTIGAGLGYMLYATVKLMSTRIRPLNKLINVGR